MSTVRSMLVVLAAVLAIAVPQPALAQTDPYVSCVRCHALPMMQAAGSLGDHGYISVPQPPEMVCDRCHETWFHEQNPSVPPARPYFWNLPLNGLGSTMTRLCVGCHPPQHLTTSHPNDVFPYLDGTPPVGMPLAVPTSVLPLFDYSGLPNQTPAIGGLVCSTCHNPHDSSYPVNGSSKFLRVGAVNDTATLCTTCHIETPPGTRGTDLVIASRSDSVRFQKLADGRLKIDVKVKNRGNISASPGTPTVFWEPETGGYRTAIGSLAFPANTMIQPEGEATGTLIWMPLPTWTEQGFFVFPLPGSTLRPFFPNEYVRAMNNLPAPTDLAVTDVGPVWVTLTWVPPSSGAGSMTFDLYRDGVKVNPYPIPGPGFQDFNLAPETPHVYTVTATQGDLTSAKSEPLGATTDVGAVLRVPHDFPTIQAAINAAGFGTSIHVAAGTYAEQLSFWNKQGITVKGQDANGCILEAPLFPGPPILLRGSGGGNTLSGFTIKNQSVDMGVGDVLAYSVLQGQTSTFVANGGLAAQCVFGQPGPTITIGPGQLFALVNSIVMGSTPIQNVYPPASSGLLLNNNFPLWGGWLAYPGSGNFGGVPWFEPPPPPVGFFTFPASITTAKGLQLRNWYPGPFPGPAPDVGAFDGSQDYTPKPPANLLASWQTAGWLRVQLTWSLSPNDPQRTMGYWIYRSETPFFPPGSETNPYMEASPGSGFFEDLDVQPGVIYYYQVRAWGGFTDPYPLPGPEPILSAPTNIAQAEDINVPPVAVNDFPTTLEDQSVIIPVLANDTDANMDPLTVAVVTPPLHGTAIRNPDNTVTYVPALDFFGTDTFTSTVTDGRGGYATAQVSVTVVPVNDPPVAMNDGTYTTLEETALVVGAPGVLGNDTDVDSVLLNAVLFAGPAHGTLTLDSAGFFTYTPAANYNGPDSFTYRASDGQATSGVATVAITVAAVNDRPVADSQSVSTNEDTNVAMTLTATDAEGDPLIYTVKTFPTKGTLSGTAPNLTYQPAANDSGVYSFTFTASDGSLESDPATVTITVHPVNDAPAAANDGTYTTLEDTALVVGAPGVLGNDTDIDSTMLSAVLVSGPAHGTLTLNAAGSFTYTPAANYNGPDSFTYRASDGQATSGVATVAITVAAVNDAPIANAGPDKSVKVSTSTTFNGSGSADVDGTIVSYTWNFGDGTTATGLNVTKKYKKTGTFTVTLTVKDNQGATGTDTARVTVTK